MALVKIEFLCECEKDVLLIVDEDEIEEISCCPFCKTDIDLEQESEDEY